MDLLKYDSAGIGQDHLRDRAGRRNFVDISKAVIQIGVGRIRMIGNQLLEEFQTALVLLAWITAWRYSLPQRMSSGAAASAPSSCSDRAVSPRNIQKALLQFRSVSSPRFQNLGFGFPFLNFVNAICAQFFNNLLQSDGQRISTRSIALDAPSPKWIRDVLCAPNPLPPLTKLSSVFPPAVTRTCAPTPERFDLVPSSKNCAQ